MNTITGGAKVQLKQSEMPGRLVTITSSYDQGHHVECGFVAFDYDTCYLILEMAPQVKV